LNVVLNLNKFISINIHAVNKEGRSHLYNNAFISYTNRY
jgi:hypothetical protein